VFQDEVLVLKLVAVDRFSARTIVVREIPTLAHEARNDAMERRPLVPKALFARAERSKVLGRLGDHVGTELHDDTSGGISTNRDIKIHLGFAPEFV
jgi:hypothetical protein